MRNSFLHGIHLVWWGYQCFALGLSAQDWRETDGQETFLKLLKVLLICLKQGSLLHIYIHPCIWKIVSERSLNPKVIWWNLKLSLRQVVCSNVDLTPSCAAKPSAFQRKAKGRGKWGWSIRIWNDFMPNAACGCEMPRFDQRMVCFTWIEGRFTCAEWSFAVENWYQYQ